MHPELAIIADRWRATMPITRPKSLTRLPENLHPQLVNDLYPLKVVDVYTRTYKALISTAVPAKLKHDALLALGNGMDLHYLQLRMPTYQWTTMENRRCRIWDQVNLEHGARIAHSTKSSAFRYLITISAFLADHSKDFYPEKWARDEIVEILERKADIPHACADLVTAAEPLLRKTKTAVR